MALFVEEVLDDLESQGIVTKGVDGFYGQMPEIGGTVVTLYDSGGAGSAEAPHSARSEIDIECRVRGDTYSAARIKAAKVYNRWQGMVNLATASFRVIAVHCNGLPASSGRDEADRDVVSFGAKFVVVPNPGVYGDRGGSPDPNQ